MLLVKLARCDLGLETQALSSQQARSVAATLKRRLMDAPKGLQRRYVRGLVANITVSKELAVITGPDAALASCASNPDHLGAVPSSMRGWCPQRESNSCFSLERAAS
jgi:hypothetical protein